MNATTTATAPATGFAAFEALVRAVAWTEGTTHVVMTRFEEHPLVPVEFTDGDAAERYADEYPEGYPRHADVGAFVIAL